MVTCALIDALRCEARSVFMDAVVGLSNDYLKEVLTLPLLGYLSTAAKVKLSARVYDFSADVKVVAIASKCLLVFLQGYHKNIAFAVRTESRMLASRCEGGL